MDAPASAPPTLSEAKSSDWCPDFASSACLMVPVARFASHLGGFTQFRSVFVAVCWAGNGSAAGIARALRFYEELVD